MTTQAVTIAAITLTGWTGETPEAELRSAFRRKNAWVVNAPRTPALWYTVVLNNLSCRYVRPEATTVESVRVALNKGLSRAAFERLKLITGVSSEELSKVIRIPQRTLSRRERFKPDESERILRVASVFQKTLEVLGNLESARRWYTSPKRALGERTPLEFCDTAPGAEEVEHLLGRIEHGVFT